MLRPEPGDSGRAAPLSRPSRVRAGSLADLRSRLARLPDGHPSSFYDDGGQVRPLPVRLKQLELGLPAPGREPASSFRPDTSTDDIADHAGAGRGHPGTDQPAAVHTAVVHAEPDVAETLEPELPDPVSSEPDYAALDDAVLDDAPSEAADLPRRGHRGPDFQSRREPTMGSSPQDSADDVKTPFPAQNRDGHRSAPPDWGKPYADAGEGHATSDGSNDLNLGPWQASQRPRASGLEGLSSGGGNGRGRTNGHVSRQHLRPGVPRPDRLDPGQRDAARRDTVQHGIVEPRAGRPDDGPAHGSQPDASRLGAGGATAADLRPVVDRTLARCRAAEGRNVFGSYGSSGLTPAIQRMAAHLPFGGLAPGSEAHSLKTPERFAAKLARLIARNPGRAPEELAATIGDAVRYTFAFEAADYVEGTWLVHRRLKSQGFELEIRRNRWESPEYKGIFTQWRDPAHDLAFEVQFHTMASWAVVQRTHDAYVQITDPATPPAERARLRARQVAVAATAQAPPNWTEIADFRLESR